MKLKALNDSAALDLSRADGINLFSPRRKFLLLALIFIVAFGVRVVNWRTHGNEVQAVQTKVALNYKHLAGLIHANGPGSLYDASSPTNDPDLLGHPPGYPLLLSLIYRFAPNSDHATQLTQMVFDSLSVVLIVLISFELLPVAVGIIAGLLAAFAPQFSWNSILLLPDSLAALPILLAIWLIVRAVMRPSSATHKLLRVFLAGALVGVSCWLRANSALLAPFLAIPFLLFCKRGARWQPVLALIGGCVLLIAPITIRNAVVYHQFIPVSLGAGQTLIEGIADYNTDGSLGLPQTDMELIRGEAESFHRPDYANSLFSPDGIERDRARIKRGLAVIGAHPVWFLSVMVRRAASMFKLERTPLRLAANDDGSWQPLPWLLRVVQKLFITAIFLPLAFIGAALLCHERRWRTLALLLVVPFYYCCTQSALHTEYRYVLVIQCFLFVLAAVAIHRLASQVVKWWA